MPFRYKYEVDLKLFDDNTSVNIDCWSLKEIENLEVLEDFKLTKNKIVIMVEKGTPRTYENQLLKIKKIPRYDKLDMDVCLIED